MYQNFSPAIEVTLRLSTLYLPNKKLKAEWHVHGLKQQIIQMPPQQCTGWVRTSFQYVPMVPTANLVSLYSNLVSLYSNLFILQCCIFLIYVNYAVFFWFP